MIIITSSLAKKKQAVLVHGWEGGPAKKWFPWLSDKLTKLNYRVINLSMPDPNYSKRFFFFKQKTAYEIDM